MGMGGLIQIIGYLSYAYWSHIAEYPIRLVAFKFVGILLIMQFIFSVTILNINAMAYLYRAWMENKLNHWSKERKIIMDNG